MASDVDPNFILWSLDQNRRYEMSRAIYRNAYPPMSRAELVRRETHFAELREKWLEKLRGMRD